MSSQDEVVAEDEGKRRDREIITRAQLMKGDKFYGSSEGENNRSNTLSAFFFFYLIQSLLAHSFPVAWCSCDRH